MRIKNQKWLIFLVISAMILKMLPVSQAVERKEDSQKMYQITCENEYVTFTVDGKAPEGETVEAPEGAEVVIAPEAGYAITETPIVEKAEVESSETESGKVELQVSGGAVNAEGEETELGIPVKLHGEDAYEFVMPAYDVNISVKTEEAQTPTPNVSPTPTPIEEPSEQPSETPSLVPTDTPKPTQMPTTKPTLEPTTAPTVVPTQQPTAEPTVTPPVIDTSPVETESPGIDTPDIVQSPVPLPVISEAPEKSPGIANSPMPTHSIDSKSELDVRQKSITLSTFCKIKSKPKQGIYVPSLKMKEKIKVVYDTKRYMVTYCSSNSKVVTVDKSGMLKAGKMGKANVVVYLHKKGSKEIEESHIVSVRVKPVIYLRHLTGKKYIVNKGKKFKNRKGIRFYVVGVDKPFYLFYRSGNKKYSIYLNKKWKKNVRSIPKAKKTWIPLSGKKYSFYISTNKKGKKNGAGSSNVIVWKS